MIGGHGRVTVRSRLAILMVLLAAANLEAAEPVWTISQLNAARENWATLAGTPLRIEGRVSSQIKGQMRFQNCNLSFVLSPELERRITQARNVEVAGSLRREGTGLVFEVTDVKPLPTDLEQFRAREGALRNAQPDDWYELANWAKERSRLYQDQELLEAALTCRARGVAIEMSRLRIENYQGRFDLARKVKDLELPEKLGDELRHEGYRTWWLQTSTTTAPPVEELQAIVEQLRKDWPDALEPGSPFPTDVLRAYTENPTETYRLADDSRRQILRRIFASEVQLRLLQVKAAPDGRDGKDIAQQIRETIPERQTIAERYHDAWLTYRVKQVDTSAKGDALQLANELRARARPQDASEALLRWLVAKEQRLRPQTAPEFTELARDYFTLLNDESRAVALLTEAHRREPQSVDVHNQFGQLGYVFDGVTWKKTRTQPPPTADPNRAITPTELSVGMTQQELQLMLGQPTSRARVSGKSGTDEFWMFGAVGEGSRLVIELRRGDPEQPYRVLRFYHR